MRTMLTGFHGWMSMSSRADETTRLIDGSITVVLTLLFVLTLTLLG